MARFENHSSYVTDTDYNRNWMILPVERCLWSKAVEEAPVGWRIPTLDELQSLLAGQKEWLEQCNNAFGDDNLPTDWFWVYKIDPARQAEWDASDKSPAAAEALSLEKPGHVAAYFVWMGRQPANRRIESALCRYVQWD